jgi:arginine-tRNA-protein transferase
LDATRFNISKSQKKVLNKFNRYIKGTWDPDGASKVTEAAAAEQKPKKPAETMKPANYVQVKSLKDIIHEPEIQNENKYKLKVSRVCARFFRSSLIQNSILTSSRKLD